MRVKASRNDADSAATTRSHASAIEQPTPAATPGTAATQGLSRPTTARMTRLARSSAVTSKPSCASFPPTSAPELNAPPAPVTSTTRTSSRAAAASSSPASASLIAGVIALRACGRSMVSRSTPSAYSLRRSLTLRPYGAVTSDAGRRARVIGGRARVAEGTAR